LSKERPEPAHPEKEKRIEGSAKVKEAKFLQNGPLLTCIPEKEERAFSLTTQGIEKRRTS